jgi:poly(A) polymerase
METRLRTKHGSVIRRYHDNVGKQVGSSLYVHKLYADQIIPKAILTKGIEIMTRSNPSFNYNCLMWDVAAKTLRFDEAPDFDSAREPHVGEYVVVSLDGKFPPRHGKSNSIWHHKWLWVKDDYTGFDVDKSKDWSRVWLSKLDEPAKGTDLTWQSQLRKHQLAEAKTKGDDVIHGGIWGTGRIVALKNVGGHTRDMGYNRWVYYQEKSVVFWHHYPPDAESNAEVANYLIQKGYEVKENRPMEDYYKVMDFIGEEKTQVMEANQDEAALDFLKKMVRTGPFASQVYLAGGAVRDMVMGQVPKDLDVVVTNNGKEGGMKFATWLAQQMGNFKEGSNPVLFPVFGTAKVVLTGEHNGVSLDGFDVEAVFARKEVYTPGSRKPEVFLGTIQDDAFRRDFTTNSLMMDLTTGEILDLTGQGKNDIKAGIIRTPSNPDEIFGQDALRMFRAIRFATKYDWNIDPATWEGIKNNLNNLGNTSMERVRDELDKILLTKNPARGIRLLRDVGLLPHVAKELQQAVGMTQNVHHKDDVFDHTLEVLKKTKPELVNRLTALFHDIGKVATRAETPTGVKFYQHESVGAEIVERILRDLKYPTEIIDAVKAGVANHMRLKQGGDDAAQLTDKALRKFKIDLGNNLEAVLDVIHADNISHADASSMPNQIERVRQRLQSLDITVTKPNLPINGNDLIALGIPKGPKFSQILAAVAEAWFENPNVTRDQAIEIAKKFV